MANRTGRKPSDEESARMRADGYKTPAEVATELGVARTTVYDWARGLKGTMYEDNKPSVKVGANGAVWVHPGAARAVKERRA